MILGRLPVALFLLSKADGAFSSSVDGLTELTGQIALNFTREVEKKVEAKQDVMEYIERRANEIANNPEFAISEKGVKEFDGELGLLAKGFAHDEKGLGGVPDPNRISMLINQVPGDFKEFISIAKRVHASTILKYLPLTNCWKNQRDFFRSIVSIYPDYYDEKVWEAAGIDWEKNLWAVCEADNIVLMAKILKDIKSEDALKNFNTKLVPMCCKYDAKNIFDLAKLNPVDMMPHLELLSVNSSARLLELYQTRVKVPRLHLEKYAPPQKSPADVKGLIFLLDNGHDQFPMSLHIKNACNWGRLRILKYLKKLDSSLVPSEEDLKLAAKKGRRSIIEWAFTVNLIDNYSIETFIVILAVNHHFRALDLLLDELKTSFVERAEILVIKSIEAGDLKALQWMIEKWKITQGNMEWINKAAYMGRTLVFEWLYKKFTFLPGTWTWYLGNATVDTLELVQTKNPSLINRDSVRQGAGNLSLLRWIFKKRPELLNDAEWEYLSREGHERWLREWILAKDWVDGEELVEYVKGNLKLLQHVSFDKPGLLSVAEREVLLEGKHYAWLEKWEATKDVNLIDEKLIEILTRSFELLHWASNYLPSLLGDAENECISKVEHNTWVMKWIHKNPNTPPSTSDMEGAYRAGDLAAVIWARDKWGILPTKDNAFCALNSASFKTLEWLYENYPELLDISLALHTAIENGNLTFAEKLIKKYTSERPRGFQIHSNMITCSRRRLEILLWIKKYNLLLNVNSEMEQAAKMGHSQNFEWLVKNYPREIANSCAWMVAAEYGHQNIYELLLKEHPKERHRDEIICDLRSAASNGHLGVVRLILKEYPSLVKSLIKFKLDSSNYHAYHYLIKKYSDKGFDVAM